MAISRADLLKELLPGLEALFGIEYDKYESGCNEIEVDFNGTNARQPRASDTETVDND